MLTGEYQFNCQFTSSTTLPAFKGSMLRGSFGHALKAVTCALRKRQCPDCLLSATCVYSLIFEASKPTPAYHVKARVAARPHPYVLFPPLEETRSYKSGDTFQFGMTLFGRANDFLPHIIYAFERLGETGLRARSKAGPGRFSLESMSTGSITVYDGDRKILDRNQAAQPLVLETVPEQVRSLTVHLITPLRLKQDNRLQNQLPFQTVIRAVLRRISTLENAFGQGEPDLDYPGLVKRAGKVEITQCDCRWVDLKRYSNRQQTGMLMGGLQGSITYNGELAEFMPLLRYCEKTNLGKQTTFGLGRIGLLLGGRH